VNRLILKYGYPITVVILLVFAWVVYRRLAGGVDAIIPLAVAAIVVWVFGSLAFIYYWPRYLLTRCTPCWSAPPSQRPPAA
jgi:hypothetical protein